MSSSFSRKLALDHESVVLVLQGGGALGAYQAGIFEELTAIGAEPTWVAGVSIGAINAALIAGNALEHRIDRLREFWELVSSGPARQAPIFDGQRGPFNQWSATWAATFGVPGFYRPRVPPAMLQPEGTPGALSIYDAGELRSTLERLVDFDRINAKTMRLSVGAVNIATGNSKWFDNFDPKMTIGPEHIMASGALPPAFAPVMIDGDAYWDGGILSNTPLQYVLDERDDEKLLVVQVDLFPARGPVPANLAGVLQRHKDIMYSSRSRFTTEKIAEMQRMRGAMRRLIKRLPETLRDDPDLRALDSSLRSPHVDIVHLIYRQSAFESDSKDYEFSRPSMREHWAAGVADMRRTHEHLDRLEASNLDSDVTVYDLAQGINAAHGPAGVRDREETVALIKASKTLAKERTPKPSVAKARKPPPSSKTKG
ncbi:MAG: patatin-like phospholipase family protein [Burkholderiaceae bacterium]